MNRQVFTLMTVFLMLGALWNGAWGANGDFIQNINKSTGASLADKQYYLIATENHTSFLTGTEVSIDDGTIYTTLGTPLTNITSTTSEIDAALWEIVNYAPAPENQIMGCYLINKSTGGTLTFTADGKALKNGEDSDPKNFRTVVSWFTDNKYQGANTFKSIRILGTDRYITTDNETADNDGTTFNVFTTEKDDMTAELLNKRMGNGFILAVKNVSNIEETPLLNNKLVALTFKMSNTHAIESTADETSAKSITGFSGGEVSKRTYFISEMPEIFKNLISKNENEDEKYTLSIEKDNVEDILKAFKEATFVAIGKDIVLNLNSVYNKNKGEGLLFTKVKGKDLLNNTTPITRSQFEVKYNPSQGTALNINDIIITLPNATYGTGDNAVNGIRPWAVPLVENKYYLITIPNIEQDEKERADTHFCFSSSSGIVSYNTFRDNAYSISVADKEIEIINGGGTLTSLESFNLTIQPLSSEKYIQPEDEDQEEYYSGDKSTNVFFDYPNEYLSNKPEGQWIITQDSEHNDCFFLNNRESGESFRFGGEDHIIYKVDGADDLYYIPSGIIGYYNEQKIKVDTLRLTEQTLKSAFDGYAYGGKLFDPVTLKNTSYELGIQNGTFDGKVVFVQKSLTHNNTLVVDVKLDEGLLFYLIPYDTVSYGITIPEIEKGYHDNAKKQPIDKLKLKRIKFALQERTSKRYVIYDYNERTFRIADDDDVDEALIKAAKFFFKEKENGQYVLLHCEEEKQKFKGEDVWVDITKNKVYANIGDAFLHQINMYKKDIADRFGFYTNASPMYADIMKKLKGNTPENNDTTLFKINLYSVQNRSGNQKYMLAAGQHNFLTEGIPDTRSDIIINSKAIGGLAYDSIKFSIIVDTAYVRRTLMMFDEDGNPTLDEKIGKKDSSSVMPLYYLGMSSLDPKENVTQDTIGPLHPWDTDYLGHKIECQHYTIKSSGNYLFAMTDSIEHGLDNIVKREDHCYHYWNTHHPRLRFVHATHEEDTMIVTSIHGSPKDTLIGGKITTTIEAMKETEWLAPQIYDENAPDNRPNYGLFAFEVNPNPFDPEVPEYALWNPASKKYIAYVNGNLIMEDQPSYYTLDIKSEGHSIVSNEMVRTSDVRVVAAQGKVIIQNAAGKKVFLQTALGKTLADTVLTSDQEEMAAPAGIVFVTVEGEETVKTIVK